MRLTITKIIISFFLLILGLFLNNMPIFSFLLFTTSYIILGTDIAIKAFKSLIKKSIFDENLLMFISTVGAFLLGEYPEGAAVMIFYHVGELFSFRAKKKSERFIQQMLKSEPEYITVVVNGCMKNKKIREIMPKDIIMIKAGEKVPLDCVVTDGYSSVNNSALTGESTPISVSPGDKIISGSINVTGTIFAEVRSKYEHSTFYKILDLVKHSTEKKAHTEKFITKFSSYYTPAIIGCAVFIGVFMPFIFPSTDISDWIYRSLVFLVVSCPCALVISIPLTFFCGIGLASKKGIIIKGSSYIESLSFASKVVFDKTGTLTKGLFSVNKIVSISMSKEKFLETASYAELYSDHPIATSIKKFYDKDFDETRIKSCENIAGKGIKSVFDNKVVYIGNSKLMESIGITTNKVLGLGSVAHMSVDGKYCGYIVVSDSIKDQALTAVQKLYKLGIERIAMLTGDSKEISDSVANALGIHYSVSELLPEDKVEEIKKLSSNENGHGSLVFVGDGINDAPVIALAEVGIAMGTTGADISVETADIIIMDGNPCKVCDAISLSRFTMNVAKQNIALSLGIKFIILSLGIMGFLSLWAAVFADVGVSLIVILNSLRILKK